MGCVFSRIILFADQLCAWCVLDGDLHAFSHMKNVLTFSQKWAAIKAVFGVFCADNFMHHRTFGRRMQKTRWVLTFLALIYLYRWYKKMQSAKAKANGPTRTSLNAGSTKEEVRWLAHN